MITLNFDYVIDNYVSLDNKWIGIIHNKITVLVRRNLQAGDIYLRPILI
jgi:hypothetical protein